VHLLQTVQAAAARAAGKAARRAQRSLATIAPVAVPMPATSSQDDESSSAAHTSTNPPGDTVRYSPDGGVGNSSSNTGSAPAAIPEVAAQPGAEIQDQDSYSISDITGRSRISVAGYHLSDQIHYLPDQIQHLPDQIHHLPDQIHHLPDQIHHLSNLIHHLSDQIRHLDGLIQRHVWDFYRECVAH
jgi:hypothetical protein